MVCSVFSVFIPYRAVSPGDTLGDSWLEHKGKMMLSAPDAAQGRRGLMEILQQTSNPYQDGRAMGDAWLQQKGKLKVPGRSRGKLQGVGWVGVRLGAGGA
jgi:hypothetical protein